MIIYEGSCRQFIEQCEGDSPTIGELIIDGFNKNHCGFSDTEPKVWNNSLPFLAKALKDSKVPLDTEIGIEYRVRGKNQRIDAIVCGVNSEGNESAVVIELKQWSSASFTEKPYFVHTFGGHGYDDYWHPSYQA